MAAVAIEDLSGTSTITGANPYKSLIDAAEDDDVSPSTTSVPFAQHLTSPDSDPDAI